MLCPKHCTLVFLTSNIHHRKVPARPLSEHVNQKMASSLWIEWRLSDPSLFLQLWKGKSIIQWRRKDPQNPELRGCGEYLQTYKQGAHHVFLSCVLKILSHSVLSCFLSQVDPSWWRRKLNQHIKPTHNLVVSQTNTPDVRVTISLVWGTIQ